ncbi:MAG: caspase family protein [Gemmatimonadaceae bacterium]|nr:caspase family protein [Gemmatimonadaceae bacterium]
MPALRLPHVAPSALRLRRLLTAAITFAAGAAIVAPLQAQVRRALIVGINDYEAFLPPTAARTAVASQARRTPAPREAGARGTISNLEGSANDAQAVAQVVTARFGFRRTDVRLLIDRQATRRAIIDSLTAMLARSKPGDVAFFSYAGHGALRRNTLTPGKQVDQTLVPVDANAGAEDIRDKELAAILAPAAARGVIVTAVIDACNSGSITRGGVPSLLRERWAAIDERDKAERYTGDFPAEKGALIIAAAEDTRPAKEGMDENGTRHGLFTAAFLQALLSNSVNASARTIFQSTKAIMQGRAPDQVPSIDAQASRLRQPLFGGAGSEGATRTTVAITQLRGEQAELDGGLALGLRPGTELARLVRGVPDTTFIIRVERNTSIARSLASIVKGSEDSLKIGDLYTITRWVAADEPLLRVWVPSPLASDAVRDAAVAEARLLKASTQVTWVDDPTRLPSSTQPLVTVAFEEGWWTLRTGRELPAKIGATLQANRVLSAIGQLGVKNAAVWLSIPPTRALDQALAIGGAQQAAGITREGAPEGAFYVLAGRVTDAGVSYAWVRSNAAAADTAYSAFPPRSNWFPVSTAPSAMAAADSLRMRAEALGRVRTWLTIATPPDEGQFPYRLVVVDSASQRPVTADSLASGTVIQLRLDADTARLAAAATRAPRFVYVFDIDSKGKATLLFPADGTNASNRVPYFMGNREVWPEAIPVTDAGGRVASFGATDIGVESLLMVTSEQELPRDVFEWDAVVAAEMTRGGNDSALGSLLRSRIGGTRGLGARNGSAPATWSLQRVQVRVVPAAR